MAGALLVGGLSGLAGAAGFTVVDDLVGGDGATDMRAHTAHAVDLPSSGSPAGLHEDAEVIRHAIASIDPVRQTGWLQATTEP